MSQVKFDKAVSIVQNLPKDGPVQPSQDDKLFFYSYYKQATVGDVNTSRPGLLDFVGKAKWDAWDKVKGTSKEEAFAKYVDRLVEILKSNDSAESKKYVEEIESA
ncbi:acyl-CoA-binding protein [Sistotremastrum niveocremeum HHB9708]|uniref:Acyl-CoA-binding protein n=1 Tax=Sistotremastrum niveocremeum HHB9708 TaxID=1314777 RepID=A0A164VH27_9AGAM|nr:acyl-CoA-binding protein [Sistotremastrum niveocremeum HHB9708]